MISISIGNSHYNLVENFLTIGIFLMDAFYLWDSETISLAV